MGILRDRMIEEMKLRNFSPPPRGNVGQLEDAENALFHLQDLAYCPVKYRLELGPAMLPRHIHCLPHGISYDDELRRPPIFVPSSSIDIQR